MNARTILFALLMGLVTAAVLHLLTPGSPAAFAGHVIMWGSLYWALGLSGEQVRCRLLRRRSLPGAE
jgi:hypothetical protein